MTHGEAIELDLSAGAYVKGIPLSPTTFMAATTFRQLRTVTRDPDVLQPGSKRGNDDPDIEGERAIHELIQRALAGNKKSNVPKYVTYIEKLVRGEAPGVLPPIHLWSSAALKVVRNGSTTYVVVPNGEHLLAIDGETQLAAHHALGRSNVVDADTRERHHELPLGAVVHHGISVLTARQYFHDLNILAVRPNTSLGLSMDTQDPVMQVVSDVEMGIDLLAGRVEKMSRQLAKASNKIVTLQALRQMVVNLVKGISGVAYGARPVPVEGVDLREVTTVAIDWIGGYLKHFESQVLDRETSLAGNAAILAAVGAMGSELLTLGPDRRRQHRDALLANLAQVDWSKGEHWVGIAGNYTTRGIFSVKGTKEVAYAVHSALADDQSAGYHRIRGGN